MTDRVPSIRCLSSQRVELSSHFVYRADEVEMPDGSRSRYYYQERGAAAVIVPVTPRGEMILVRQYRYPIGAWCLEVPAGMADGDDPAAAARRELREEVGGTATEWRHIGSNAALANAATQRNEIFLATGVELGESSPESSEDIEIVKVPVARALAMARSGEIATASSALAILRCEPYLTRWQEENHHG